MREKVLQILYKIFPFDLTGDGCIPSPKDNIRISCVINFYGRLDLLSGILYSLAEQDYSKELFEIILVEDQGGTASGRLMAEHFAQLLNIIYLPLDKNFGKMGYSRNYGLMHTRGEVILFLDDDTVILQKDFLTTLERLFEQNSSVDAVVPHGHAVFSCVEDRYDFHDTYFMTSRCTAHRRSVLKELGGFMSCFVGQEDVEFVTRFVIAGKQSFNSDNLHYYHPPLLVPNTRKPRAVGFSFYGLKGRYSLLIWLLLLVNCARHAPLIFIPLRRLKEQGRFGIGFILGVFDGFFGKKGQMYG